MTVLEIVLADANVLFGRIERDFLLNAAAEGFIQVRWSPKILDEFRIALVREQRMDESSAVALTSAMDRFFRRSNVEPTPASFEQLDPEDFAGDLDDLHVVAAAIEAHASIICTDNIKDFPKDVLRSLEIEALTYDGLFAAIGQGNPTAVRTITERTLIDRHRRKCTVEDLVAGLQRAQHSGTAALVIEATGGMVWVNPHHRRGRPVDGHWRRPPA